MSLNLIASVDKNWGIGNKGKLLLPIPKDMQIFKSLTVGNIIVMGRKTLESLPGGNPLPDRINIVLTKDKNYYKDGVIVVNSISEVFDFINKKSLRKNIFVIGGESIYKQFLPYCDTAYITYIDKEFEADTHLENLDKIHDWKLIIKSGRYTDEKSNTDFYFRQYKKYKHERMNNNGKTK